MWQLDCPGNLNLEHFGTFYFFIIVNQVLII